MREEVAYTKVCCLNDARFDAMEHLRYVPVMVLWERVENGEAVYVGQLCVHIHRLHCAQPSIKVHEPSQTWYTALTYR